MALFSFFKNQDVYAELKNELHEVKERLRVLDNFAGVGLW